MVNNRVKIVCTIGPATWDQEVMRQIIEAGMDCARVNGAFADPAELDKVKNLVRNVSDNVSLMLDVKGPEVRMNKFPEPKSIKPGDEIVIGNDESSEIYPANYKDLYQHINVGQRVVIGDGDVELIVERKEGDKLYCKVVFGEVLKPGKALNLPGADYSSEVLTEKDKENLKHGIETGWDFVSASFIQDAESAKKIREFIGDAPMKLIAKIENQAGVDNIDEILEIVDGVMIARGGLGVELGLENVPMVQRKLIQKCNDVGKPVITATQMLESMTMNPRPTRAEVNDVATAVLLGTDAVMLSAESSAGKYPVEAVKELTRISQAVYPHLEPKILNTNVNFRTSAAAIAKAAADLAIEMDKELQAVIVVSQSGATSRLIGRHGIKQPIFAFTQNEFYMRTTLLSKGIEKAFVFEGIDHTSPEYNRDHAVKMILDKVKAEGIVNKGKVLFVGKTPIDTKGYFPNLFEVIEIQ